jgi:hypothetical protein
MAAVRFIEVQSRPTEFLDLTSLTPDEFEQLIPPFEEAFQAHMARWELPAEFRYTTLVYRTILCYHRADSPGRAPACMQGVTRMMPETCRVKKLM